MKRVIVDTGPLIAYFDRDSEHHTWTRRQFERLPDPLLSCQPVLTETVFLLKRNGMDPDLALALVERGELICDLDLGQEVHSIRSLLKKYRDLPAALADVCLVRMSELEQHCTIFTLDRQFLLYRRNGRQVIPLLSPFSDARRQGNEQ